MYFPLDLTLGQKYESLLEKPGQKQKLNLAHILLTMTTERRFNKSQVSIIKTFCLFFLWDILVGLLDLPSLDEWK